MSLVCYNHCKDDATPHIEGKKKRKKPCWERRVSKEGRGGEPREHAQVRRGCKNKQRDSAAAVKVSRNDDVRAGDRQRVIGYVQGTEGEGTRQNCPSRRGKRFTQSKVSFLTSRCELLWPVEFPLTSQRWCRTCQRGGIKKKASVRNVCVY